MKAATKPVMRCGGGEDGCKNADCQHGVQHAIGLCPGFVVALGVLLWLTLFCSCLYCFNCVLALFEVF